MRAVNSIILWFMVALAVGCGRAVNSRVDVASQAARVIREDLKKAHYPLSLDFLLHQLGPEEKWSWTAIESGALTDGRYRQVAIYSCPKLVLPGVGFYGVEITQERIGAGHAMSVVRARLCFHVGGTDFFADVTP